METSTVAFDVFCPAGSVAEVRRIAITVRIDPITGDEILTPEAHEAIDLARKHNLGRLMYITNRDTP